MTSLNDAHSHVQENSSVYAFMHICQSKAVPFMRVSPVSYADSFYGSHIAYVCRRERKKSDKDIQEEEISDLLELIEEEIGFTVQWPL